MRRLLLLSFVLVCAPLSFANDNKTTVAKRPAGKKSKQSVANTSSRSKPRAGSGAQLIIEPKLRPTSDWVFVVDNSDSMLDVFHKALTGFKHVTQFPTDEWRFKLVTFSDQGKQRTYLKKHGKKTDDWHIASPKSFAAARKWTNKKANRGVTSHGLPAMLKALSEPRSNLTIVLISDGGFTKACGGRGFEKIEKRIAAYQAWREKKQYGPAIIISIGIRNAHYSAFCKACNRNYPNARHNYSLPDRWQSNKGHKPSDKDCQAFMQRLGTNYLGGYVLVSNMGR